MTAGRAFAAAVCRKGFFYCASYGILLLIGKRISFLARFDSFEFWKTRAIFWLHEIWRHKSQYAKSRAVFSSGVVAFCDE